MQQKQEKTNKHDTRESRFMNEHNTTATEQLFKKKKNILAAPEQFKQSDTKLQLHYWAFMALKSKFSFLS